MDKNFFFLKKKERISHTHSHTHTLSRTQRQICQKKIIQSFVFRFRSCCRCLSMFNDQLMNDDDEMTSMFSNIFLPENFFFCYLFLIFFVSFIHSFIYIFFLLQNDEDKTYHQQITCTHIIII